MSEGNGCQAEVASDRREVPRQGRWLRHNTPAALAIGALSLIELLASVAIVAALAALLLPVLSNTFEKSRLTECTQRMKQLGAAFHLYAADNDGRLPTQSGESLVFLDSTDSWTGKLYPYIRSYKPMCCSSSPNFARRVPNTYLYNGWVALLNSSGGATSFHNPRGYDAVRLLSSKQPTKDVLVIDNCSFVGGYALVDGSGAGQTNPITQSESTAFPHPAPRSGGLRATPQAKRNILYVDGHVEPKSPVIGQEIAFENWRWPTQ